MVDPGVFLRAWILTQADLVLALGGGDNLRLSPWIEVKPATAVPRVTYLQVSGEAEWTLQGPAGLLRPRVQLDVWDTDRDRAMQIAWLIRGNATNRRLDGYLGTLARMTVKYCRCVDQRDNFVSPFLGDTKGIGSIQLDFAMAIQDV